MPIYFYLFFFQIFPFFIGSFELQQKVKEANEQYQIGENSPIYLEQQKAFNQALKNYAEILEDVDSPSSHLYVMLANSYFQLHEKAWAILYYEKALQLDPYNLFIQANLNQAQVSLGLETSTASFTKFKNFFFSFLNLEKNIQYLSFVLLLIVIVVSLVIWMPNKLTFLIAKLFASIFLLLLLNILINLYFNPIQGILIESTGYYRGPDENLSQVSNFPQPAGTKMTILDSNTTGSWLKVVDLEGAVGYVPASTIRII